MIRRVILWCAIAMPFPAAAKPWQPWAAQIAEASDRFGVPQAWIERVILAESGGRTTRRGRPVRSRAGAIGLMQLMPRTWREIRARHGLGPDPDDPRDNILAGTAYLRDMYDRFGYPGLFAAYNAGPARYAHHLARGTRLPSETISYLSQVARDAGSSLDGTTPPRGGAPRLNASGVTPVFGTSGKNSEPDALRSHIFFPLGTTLLRVTSPKQDPVRPRR